MKRLLVALLLIGSVAYAQQQPNPIVIQGFRGLNTATSPFTLGPEWFTFAHNVAYDPPGSIRKRKGFDPIDTIPGMDSIVHNGLFASFYDDGTQQLVVVADSSGVGYGAIYLSPLGSTNISDSATRIWDHWGVTAPPFFEQYKNNLYIANGAHRPIVYNKNSAVARELPLRRPGEPRVVPLNSPGPLLGEYIYRVAAEGVNLGFTGAGFRDGVLTDPIRVDSGQVWLGEFPRPTYDSVNTPWRVRYELNGVSPASLTTFYVKIDTDSCGYQSDASPTEEEILLGLRDAINAQAGGTVDAFVDQDTNELEIIAEAQYGSYACSSSQDGVRFNLAGDSSWSLVIHRTKANPGQLDPLDQGWEVKDTSFSYNDTTEFDDWTFIDSTADASLIFNALLYNDNSDGRDSNGTLIFRYGAPHYLSQSATATPANYGVYGGWPTGQNTIYGIVYVVTFEDEITDLQSDTSRACVIFKEAGAINDTDIAYTVTLPATPANATNLIKNIYRGYLLSLPDTAWVIDTVEGYEAALCYTLQELGIAVCLPTEDWNKVERRFWRLIPDSLYFTKLTLRETVDDTVTTYTDSMRWDSLDLGTAITRPRYAQVAAPPLMNGLFTYKNRMFAYYRNRIYYSDIDAPIIGTSIENFSKWNFIRIDEGDGDEIVFASATRDYVRIWKHTKSYILYQTENGFQVEILPGDFWSNVDYLGGYGALSPHCFADALEGTYFLSQFGVILESEAAERSRFRQPQKISVPLINFEAMSGQDKGQAAAAYIPNEQKYLLSIPALDTTYVWDHEAQAWATWGLTFVASTLYRTENAINRYPGDTLYFVQSGESILNRYGTDEFDDVTSVGMRAITAPLFVDANEYTIDKVGLWTRSVDTSTFGFIFDLFNEDGNAVLNLFPGPFKDERMRLHSLAANRALYFQFQIRNNIALPGDSTVFDRFDIYWENHGLREGD